MAATLRQAVAHRRLAGGLHAAARRTDIEGHSVGVVPGSGVALVAGIRRPSTNLSADVVRVLAKDELRAVLAHERHHELKHAPARLILLTGVAAVVGRVPAVATSVERARARMEIDADAYAIATGSTKRAIVRAILKVGPTPGAIAAFGLATDLRLRALLDEERPPRRGLASDIALAAGVAVVTMTICSAFLR
jgi:beta-lactamase regulating signal transducer with metallopeptidase domain